jgi:ArsR family transcriptional regulator
MAGPCSRLDLADAAPDECDEELATLAKALAHPMRLEIIRLLKRQETCVCGEIVDQLPLAQSTVSEHLRILKEAGLIRGEVVGPRVCYCLDPQALVRLRTLVDSLC